MGKLYSISTNSYGKYAKSSPSRRFNFLGAQFSTEIRMNDEAEVFLPQTINGYQFLRYIGSGTYSHVFVVHSERYGRDFCAKVSGIAPEMLDENGNVAYEPELLCLQSFDHPNIIRLYDFFVYEDNLVLILEQCKGGDLNDVIRDVDGKWTNANLVTLMKNVVSALLYCSQHDVAHRDIKPSNIMIDEYGRAKVGDFGLSSYAPKSQLTNVQCGSRNYVAPEVLNSEMHDPYAADIWSLGVTFYQLAFKHLPWVEEVDHSMRRIEDRMFPPECDKNFVNMIKSMLDPVPERRPRIEDLITHPFFQTATTRREYRRKSDSPRLNKCESGRLQLRKPVSLATGSTVLSVRTHINKTPKKLMELGRKLTFDTF